MWKKVSETPANETQPTSNAQPAEDSHPSRSGDIEIQPLVSNADPE